MRKKTLVSVSFASVLSIGLLSAVLGCTGKLGDENHPNGPPAPSGPSTFKCDATLVPDTVPLRRLSKVQYQNTLGDIVGFALPGEREAVMATLTPLMTDVPEDVRKGPNEKYGGLTRLDQTV